MNRTHSGDGFKSEVGQTYLKAVDWLKLINMSREEYCQLKVGHGADLNERPFPVFLASLSTSIRGGVVASVGFAKNGKSNARKSPPPLTDAQE